MKLTIDDNVGITMTSHKKLVLNAKEEISLYTPKRIVIQAQSQFFAKKTRAKSGFTIESEYHFLGAVVQAEGRDRTTFPPYNDEPQKGTPPPPDPPFNWGKLLVGVVAAVAIVGFVALSVATFGAGAVIGAAAVGAALGAIGGVVSTASSDIANGKMSSLYDYGKSAAQGAVIGAICGAIFGPVAGIGGGAVIPMTGGQTTLSLGSGMFIGGSSGYIDYTIRELWDGRTPDAGKALESFAFGAVLGGGFMLGASWLSQGLSKIRGMGKGGAAPKSEGTGNGGSRASGTQTGHAEKTPDIPDKKVSPKVVNGDSGHSNHATPPKGKPDSTKKDDLQGQNKPDAEGTGNVGSSGSTGVLNVKQVEYGSNDLSKAAQQFRIDNNITGGQNVLIAEAEVNGVVKRYQIVSIREEIVLGEETIEKIIHSEKIFDDIMKKEGISPDQVKRIYSEREPCILDGHNCKQLLSKEYPNAEVTYSFEYGDQKSRNRGNKKLKQALKQLFGINQGGIEDGI
ncbi:hypothetical protein GPJ61_23855 [Brevibacillus formosus]|uniref:nucleic acid/nucleotide deaminase domain-containing protein n=1 Tax=Brevibacillus formosus TaxID=54913 RepID=UPI001CA4BD41|nr:nucleic acid/nucleotide deaminase domain-containing protein [Brevibacillus formosus]MBW5470854.1 hypothetical protein [Brevibacillus formosus]